MRRYFGTDGIRGRVGEWPITPDFALKLGFVAGRVLVHQYRCPDHSKKAAVVIGKDTRISGYMLESALEAGFAAAGVDVYLAGPLPTPAVSYLTRALRLQAGVMISASHNQYYDNGIKFFASNGLKLDDRLESEIEQALGDEDLQLTSKKLGKAHRIDDARGRYIEFCKSTFPNELDLRGLRIVVDCANGADYVVAPSILHELGAETIPLHNQPDGLNINLNCGPIAPSSLIEAVKVHQADIGLAIDGDGDRILMVDDWGRVYDGDQLLYILASALSRWGRALPGIVGTLMSNLGLEQSLKKMGVDFFRSNVGDRYVLNALLEKKWLLGGEKSGHIIDLSKHNTGDALIAALQVLEVIVREQSSLKKLAQDLKLCPQILTNVHLAANFSWQKNSKIQKSVTKAEQALQGKGRLLLRPSGTENVLRIMLEGDSRALIESLSTELTETIQEQVDISQV